MFKFLHAADIHLDSPLRGLKQYVGAPVEQIRLAARRALENLVTTAINERVQFVLIAGDVYDGDWKDFQTGLFFIQQAARLDQASIPIYLIRGNHDAGNKMTKSLRMPAKSTFFPSHLRRPCFWTKSECYSWSKLSDRFGDKGFILSLSCRSSGRFNIGLLHTSLTGREGARETTHVLYRGIVLQMGTTTWALGHIHQREIVCESR